MLPEQLLVLSVFSMLIVWGINLIWIGLFKQAKPSEGVLKGLVFAASLIFAYIWTPVALPAFTVFGGDLFVFAYGLAEFVTALLAVAVIVMKAAQVIYDVLWKKIIDGIGKTLASLFGK